MVKLLTGRRN